MQPSKRKEYTLQELADFLNEGVKEKAKRPAALKQVVFQKKLPPNKEQQQPR